MKPGASSLNPYETSYTPLARRDANDHIKAKDITHGNETAWFEYASQFAHNPHYNSASIDSVTREFDMDLNYLRMTFPGLSNDSILGVYLANNEDLEASVHMLNHLEVMANERGGSKGWDVSETGSAAHCSSLKLKNVAGETSASSSGSAQSDVASRSTLSKNSSGLSFSVFLSSIYVIEDKKYTEVGMFGKGWETLCIGVYNI
ncbi:CTC-interacting domain 5, putative isoform 2 [Hibiscus syriacus]|uniref:CTC-interacting domain 5, putative isoform 2 n=1 Tax=Hibiscus syriacus TaxID=106335 RepID=A0A6A2Z603_HIBSY|nr:CTC-interacting domain 5, putative isoform 2 [Hibiscus syriacus]